jgi:hypothetical protein
MLNLQDPGNAPKIPTSGHPPSADPAPATDKARAPIVGKLRLSQILASLSEGAVVLPATANCPKCRHDLRSPAGVNCPACGADLRTARTESPATPKGEPRAGAAAPPADTAKPQPTGPAPEVLLIPTKPKRRRIPRTNVTVGQIVDRTRQAGFGILLALFALMGMPLPGLSVPFGIAACFTGFQMTIGFDRPWVPRWVRRHRISLLTLKVLSERIARWTNWMERLIRPRFELFTRGPFWILCGACVFLEGFGLALPLPIPFSNIFFALPIVVFAIALLESDGLLMVFGFTLVAIQVVLAMLFWKTAMKAIESVWNLIG